MWRAWDATNPRFHAGALRVANSGSKSRGDKDVSAAVRTSRKQLEFLKGEGDRVIEQLNVARI